MLVRHVSPLSQARRDDINDFLIFRFGMVSTLGPEAAQRMRRSHLTYSTRLTTRQVSRTPKPLRWNVVAQLGALMLPISPPSTRIARLFSMQARQLLRSCALYADMGRSEASVP